MNCPGISPEGIVSLKTYLSDGIAFNNFGIRQVSNCTAIAWREQANTHIDIYMYVY
jgi:hypothetical protein